MDNFVPAGLHLYQFSLNTKGILNSSVGCDFPRQKRAPFPFFTDYKIFLSQINVFHIGEFVVSSTILLLVLRTYSFFEKSAHTKNLVPAVYNLQVLWDGIIHGRRNLQMKLRGPFCVNWWHDYYNYYIWNSDIFGGLIFSNNSDCTITNYTSYVRRYKYIWKNDFFYV